tara:strand:- start:221 stop:331 length:111 start_codon:yes stop_codon:yes gene_type:complete
MTNDLQFKALTPEERAKREAEMQAADEAGVCINCGS